MKLITGVKTSFIGTGIEAIGMLFDILHHLNIGIKTPEGLLTPIHFIIFAGFVINTIGVFITFRTQAN